MQMKEDSRFSVDLPYQDVQAPASESVRRLERHTNTLGQKVNGVRDRPGLARSLAACLEMTVR